MHFKRNLWLSFTGAIITIIAVLFGSKNSEATTDTQVEPVDTRSSQNSLPQIKQLKTMYYSSKTSRDINAQSSYSNH